MRFKDHSIQPKSLSTQLLLAMIIANEVYLEHGYDCVITSLNDATHSLTSLHYAGEAVDLRTRMIPTQDEKVEVRDQIKARLTSDFDVILESDHIHIEHQPRRR